MGASAAGGGEKIDTADVESPDAFGQTKKWGRSTSESPSDRARAARQGAGRPSGNVLMAGAIFSDRFSHWGRPVAERMQAKWNPSRSHRAVAADPGRAACHAARRGDEDCRGEDAGAPAASLAEQGLHPGGNRAGAGRQRGTAGSGSHQEPPDRGDGGKEDAGASQGPRKDRGTRAGAAARTSSAPETRSLQAGPRRAAARDQAAGEALAAAHGLGEGGSRGSMSGGSPGPAASPPSETAAAGTERHSSLVARTDSDDI